MGRHSVDTAAAYRELADRIESEDPDVVWGAFAERMYEQAKDRSDHHDFAGFVVNVSPSRVGNSAELADILSLGHRQYGSSPEGLKENAVARNTAVYAVMKTEPWNPLEVARDAVVDALRDAAGGE